MRWTIGIAISLSYATPAFACSVDARYRIPTNVELLQKADLVVLATVVSGVRTPEEAWAANKEPSVVLKPLKVLKGTTPRQLRVEGILSDRWGRAQRLTPTRLSEVHPSALEGGCVRGRYSRGGMVVAMFARTAKGYVQLDDPFARSVEDVRGPSDLWPRAATLYLVVLRTHRPASIRAAFQREQQRLAAQGSPDARNIAADIARYLKATRR